MTREHLVPFVLVERGPITPRQWVPYAPLGPLRAWTNDHCGCFVEEERVNYFELQAITFLWSQTRTLQQTLHFYFAILWVSHTHIMTPNATGAASFMLCPLCCFFLCLGWFCKNSFKALHWSDSKRRSCVAETKWRPNEWMWTSGSLRSCSVGSHTHSDPVAGLSGVFLSCHCWLFCSSNCRLLSIKCDDDK